MAEEGDVTFDTQTDSRIDPRIKAVMLAALSPSPGADVDSRETLLAESNSGASGEPSEEWKFTDRCDSEEIAPSDGLLVYTQQVVSAPDGNLINLRVTRPDTEATLACVYYIHGGGMAVGSCFDPVFRGWARLIAANGVAVVMVDFRNSVTASSVPEVAPFPAGLNDCVSGLRWVVTNASQLNIDPARTVVAGDSGGGNLTLATGLKLKR
ncbi:MAG TPA: alpha/beta hydrolase, partial [Acidimicrobiales bacterium]|nr:alpha/beta hydrolase [Acidimicrobiales bacterium]